MHQRRSVCSKSSEKREVGEEMGKTLGQAESSVGRNTGSGFCIDDRRRKNTTGACKMNVISGISMM